MSEPIVSLLEKTLDFSVKKQKVISENIANASTKGYQRKELKFDDFLSTAMDSRLKSSNSKHMPIKNAKQKISDYTTIKDKNEEKVSGLNNVDTNKEMADLAENQLLLKFSAKKTHMHFGVLQKVIRGGR